LKINYQEQEDAQEKDDAASLEGRIALEGREAAVGRRRKKHIISIIDTKKKISIEHQATASSGLLFPTRERVRPTLFSILIFSTSAT